MLPAPAVPRQGAIARMQGAGRTFATRSRKLFNSPLMQGAMLTGVLTDLPGIFQHTMDEVNRASDQGWGAVGATTVGVTSGIVKTIDSAFGGIPSMISQALGGVSFDELPHKFGEALDGIASMWADKRGFFASMSDLMREAGAEYYTDVEEKEQMLLVLRKKIGEARTAEEKKALQKQEELVTEYICKLKGCSPGGIIPEGYEEAFAKAEIAARQHLGNINVAMTTGMRVPGLGTAGAAGAAPMAGAAGGAPTTVAAAVTAGGGLLGQVSGIDQDGGLMIAIPNFAAAFASFEQMKRRYARKQ
jgi:hypothetical protein